MARTEELLLGHKEFYKKYFIDAPETYEKLVREGQAPKTLVIACSDSRVDPSIVFNTKPGDIFVIRNVANLVPPYECDYMHCHSTSAAIEYAVNHLKVENIVVLGHAHCGGIAALVSDEKNDHNFIDTWLYVAEEAKQKALKQATEPNQACSLCEKEAIRISLRNLMTFPFIQERTANRELELHGWYFCMETGKIEIIA